MKFKSVLEEKHYSGYNLDVRLGELKDEDIYRFESCVNLVEEQKSLRDIQKDYGIPIATLDQWIHRRLKDISDELYQCVCYQFYLNKHHKKE